MTQRLQGRAGQAARARRLLRTDGLCEDCLAEVPPRYTVAVEVDHIIPLAPPFNGPDEDDNTRNLCKPHHRIRTAQQFGFKSQVAFGLDGYPIEGDPTA